MKKQLNIASLTLLYWGLKAQEKEFLRDFDKQKNICYLKSHLKEVLLGFTLVLTYKEFNQIIPMHLNN
ncbi:hypothetical protein TAMYLO_510001 [Tenacibaculum amylolyticum]